MIVETSADATARPGQSCPIAYRSLLKIRPPRSAAHHSYFQRIARGPDFEIADEIGGRVQRFK